MSYYLRKSVHGKPASRHRLQVWTSAGDALSRKRASMRPAPAVRPLACVRAMVSPGGCLLAASRRARRPFLTTTRHVCIRSPGGTPHPSSLVTLAVQSSVWPRIAAVDFPDYSGNMPQCFV